jgi:hypothetical protein
MYFETNLTTFLYSYKPSYNEISECGKNNIVCTFPQKWSRKYINSQGIKAWAI